MGLEVTGRVGAAPLAGSTYAAEPDRYELDGVALLHQPMPGPGTLVSLVFGTGRADEPTHRSGITHLAEHLVMDGVGDLALDGNGRTEPFRVSFSFHGRPEEASRFLRRVTSAICDPLLDRIPAEISVLQTEEDGAGRGINPLLWFLRYGYTGLGTTFAPDLILWDAARDVVGAWMGSHLVAGNAAVWIAGELPDDLTLPLRGGNRPPRQAATPIAGLETPTMSVQPAPGVGASFLVPRTAATSTAFRLVGRRLTRALRIDRSLGYLVNVDYLPIDADSAHVTVYTTCQTQRVAEVEGLLLSAFDDLVAHGPTPAELDRQLDDLHFWAASPGSIPGRLDSAIRDLLFGSEPDTLVALEAEQASLTPADVSQALERATGSMLLATPSTGFVPNRGLRSYPGPSPDLFPSHSFSEPVTKKRPWDASPPTRSLRIGNDGVAVDDPAGRRLITILWSDCVAVVRAGTGRRIMGRDGYSFDIEANAWERGADAIRLVDQFAPLECTIGTAR